MTEKFRGRVLFVARSGFDQAITLPSYTVATVPSASGEGAGSLLYVTDGAAGEGVPAYSDGTDWRRVDTRAVISAT